MVLAARCVEGLGLGAHARTLPCSRPFHPGPPQSSDVCTRKSRLGSGAVAAHTRAASDDFSHSAQTPFTGVEALRPAW